MALNGVTENAIARAGLAGPDVVALMRKSALDRFFDFCVLLLGGRVNEVEHLAVCDFVQRFEEQEGVNIGIIQTPRDTLKTTICSVLFPLWCLCRNPNRLFMLDGRVHDQSKKRLAGIQAIIETNDRFTACFPGMKKDDLAWNAKEMTVGTRTDFSAKEPSIVTGGMDVEHTGMHMGMLVIDDAIGPLNSQTQDQTRAVIHHIRARSPLLTSANRPKEGKILAVNTPWAENDGWAWLKALPLPKMVFSTQAFDPVDLNFGKMETEAQFLAAGGHLNYPISLPFKKLYFQFRLMGAALFYANYQCVLLPGEDALFDTKKIWTPVRSLVPPDLRVFVVCDPAGDPTVVGGAKKDGDNVAVAAVGVSSKGDVWVLDAMVGRFTVDETIQNIVALSIKHPPYVVGAESTGLINLQHLRDAFSRAGKSFPVEAIRPRGRSKFSRISALRPFIQNGMFYVVDDMKEKEQLFYEMSRVTRGGGMPDKIDLTDAISMALDLVNTYGAPMRDEVVKAPEEVRPRREIEYWEAVDGEREREEEFTWG